MLLTQIHFQSATSDEKVETMLRSLCVELGLKVSVSATPLTMDVIKKYAVPNTVSQAWYLGRAVHMARRAKSDTIKAIVSQ